MISGPFGYLVSQIKQKLGYVLCKQYYVKGVNKLYWGTFYTHLSLLSHLW